MLYTARTIRRAAANPALRLALSLVLSAAFPLVALAQTPLVKPGTVAPKNSPAATQVLPAGSLRLVFAGKALSAPTPTTAPYRDPQDNELCITPELLEPLGIVYVRDAEHGKITLTTTNGVAVATVEPRIPPANSPQSAHGGIFIPAVQVITALGGKCEFEAATQTLYVRSVLTGVELFGGQLRISATFPVLPIITRDETGKKVILDFVGTEVGRLPKTLGLTAPHLLQARTGQFESDIARVVLEFKQPTSFVVLGGKATANLILNPIPAEGVKVAASEVKPAPKAPVKTVKGKKTPPAPPRPALVNKVEFRPLADDRAQFVLRAERVTAVRASQGKGQLVLELANALIGPKASESLGEAKHPFLRAASLIAREGKIARLAVDLTRIVNFTVKPDGNGNILIDLFLPKNAGGRLAGKLVVVDAGHGAHDHGARGVNGSREKNVNLAIAGQLADQLREAGANVMMTRADDFFIKVNDRPRIANGAGADFFISVHANDPGNGNRSINGSVVYYHGFDPHCRALAQCVAERFEGMGGIRSKGIASDLTIYPRDGFGVLRNSRMVAILVETGYMTNPNDVKHLNNPAMQRKIAGSIMLGLKDYIEGRPDLDTRSTNPEADGGRLILPLETSPMPETPTAGMPDMPENSTPSPETPSEPTPSQPGQK